MVYLRKQSWVSPVKNMGQEQGGRRMGSVWMVLGCLAAGLGLLLLLVAPGHMPLAAKRMSRFFGGLNCAHRGLHRQDQTIPENSLAAFRAAREAGYGVELDVQLSKDGEVVVFHDDDLLRACGKPERVNALEWKELQRLRLFGTEEGIPSFAEALAVLGDTPVIVELKSAGKLNAVLCEKTLEILRRCGRIWCVESFDPRMVAWFRKNAPDVLRGQLGARPQELKGLPWVAAFALGNLLTNFMTRPHFIAYRVGRSSFAVWLCRALHPMKVVWTVHGDQNPSHWEQQSDAVIFEYYAPEPRFRA